MVRAHDQRMAPMLKGIAVMFSDTKIAHVAALKGEETGEDVSVFMERRKPAGGLNLVAMEDSGRCGRVVWE